VEEQDAKALDALIEDLRKAVEPHGEMTKLGAQQPAAMLPTVFGLVQVVDQLYVHLRTLDIRVKELEGRG
jgi:hypothetical protein